MQISQWDIVAEFSRLLRSYTISQITWVQARMIARSWRKSAEFKLAIKGFHTIAQCTLIKYGPEQLSVIN